MKGTGDTSVWASEEAEPPDFRLAEGLGPAFRPRSSHVRTAPAYGFHVRPATTHNTASGQADTPRHGTRPSLSKGLSEQAYRVPPETHT
ncbi:hypothetical protein GCM10011578_087480 [Streptomyces fuscichromogenes]|uniref:Uncharacterized protein n=1 Tax=Streptomyces fuscichromogenes TaxID=1324013 RepID=A0A917XM42_9ACTN|nr:hypothetical protein GCM10011578_087480 [Streptomyces fuscichromogenes]